MNAIKGKPAIRVLTLAVQAALAAMAVTPLTAMAEDEDVAALTNPTNFVEMGAMTTHGSDKFGEYNGLNKSNGQYVIGNFGIKGGDSYGQQLGTRRWSVTGTDLGTTSRELGASVGDQGQWSMGINYDELRHYTGNGYRTPWQGGGTNTLTLPATYGVVNRNAGVTAAEEAASVPTEIYNSRKSTSFSAGYNFDRQWSVKFDFNRLDQSGSKLIGTGDEAHVAGAFAYATPGQAVAILMNPTNYKTDNANLALNWIGDQAHLSAEYFGSSFRDNYNHVTWDDPFRNGAPVGGVPPYQTSTMSTPPSNQFHQLNLKGGYSFSSATKLAGGMSYARNTQNEAYAGTYSAGTATLPTASLDGKVVIKHVDLRLTHQSSKDLSLAAGLKFDERDNRTASNMYAATDIGRTTLDNLPVNTPMSHKRTLVELAADYRIDNSQRIHAAYEYEDVKRWCNNDAANNARGSVGIVGAGYYTTASCAQVPRQREDKVKLDYKLKAGDSLNVKAGYSYGNRTADVNSSFYNPMQANVNAGGEGFEKPGFVAFFQDSRKENQLKLGGEWQATEKLAFSVGGKYSKDDYGAALGVQKGTSGSLNFDANYAYSEDSSVHAFLTSQNRSRDLRLARGNNMTTNDVWFNKLKGDDLTFGIGASQKGLMAGKLELVEDFTYSLGKDNINTSYSGVCSGTTAAPNCGDFPTIRSEMTRLRITGSYAMDKASKVVLGLIHQRLKSSDDMFYGIYQYGGPTPRIIPSDQMAPNYSASAVFAAYNYSFK